MIKLKKSDHFLDPSLPLQVYIRDPHPNFGMHVHDFDEIVVVTRGSALHVLDRNSFHIKRGDIFVISGKHKHEFCQVNNLALINVLYDARSLKLNKSDFHDLPGFQALFQLEPLSRTKTNTIGILHPPDRQFTHVTGLIQELKREADSHTPGYRVITKGLFLQLAVFLSRCYSEQPPTGSLGLLRLSKAIAYIETHFAEKITLASLARVSSLSPRQFERVFHELMGRSPIEHLRHVRIQRAAELLRNSDETVTDIALACGFSDGNYFSRQFRSVTDKTPCQFRYGHSLLSR